MIPQLARKTRRQGNVALVALFFYLVGALLSGCSRPVPGGETRAPTLSPVVNTATLVPPTSAPIATQPPTATLPPPTPAPSPTPTVAALRLPATVTEIAKGFGSPDDLLWMPDGSFLFTDEGNGTLNRVMANGLVIPLVAQLQVPEGIVLLPDGNLLLVEQGKNQVLLMRFNSDQPLSPWYRLTNNTRQEGVDNIARDPASGDIIIPDSPNGRVLRVTADGQTTRVIATGLGRPVSAAIEADGSILIADETAKAVKRLRPDGTLQSIGTFATPDDVVVDRAGNIFVVSLDDGTVNMVDPKSGRATLLATLHAPQGIAVDADGNLIVTEATANRIVRIRIH